MSEQKLTKLEAVRFFDYVDSICKSEKGTITVQDLRNAVGVDLDRDNEVTDKKLYRSVRTGKSVHTGNPVTYYVYKNQDQINDLSVDDKGAYKKYEILIHGKDELQHAIELMIYSISSDVYIKCFSDELVDNVITKEEFIDALFKPFESIDHKI